jgi:hypothetical protein
MSAIVIGAVQIALSAIAWLAQLWRRVGVTVHRGYFAGNSEQQFFVTVTNLSSKREVEVVRVWFDSVPSIEALPNPLPRRLRTDESWATWVPVSAFSPLELPYAEVRARVRLSSGKVIRSRANRDVAPAGYVPGTGPRP